MRDEAVGKAAATREPRDSSRGGGTVDFDRTDGDEAAEDFDDLQAGDRLRPLQHRYQFAQNDCRHDHRARRFAVTVSSNAIDPPSGSSANG